jgi:uncharacterized protein (DUF2235 family)
MSQDEDYQGKNLVICCDGTNNEFGENNTNVVRLLSLALKRNDQQIVFYDPGLGTFPAPGAFTPLQKWYTKTLGSAFGYGLSHNLEVCYDFLVEHYVPGDRIYLFGFSRGAYTVRALAALIHVCGLMHTKNRNLVPYVIDLFRSEATKAKKRNDIAERKAGKKLPLSLPVCNEFKRVFCITPTIHFLGVWDTVSSVGTIFDPFHLPHTRWNPSVITVRHAISIDEKRKFFRTNLWSSSGQSTHVKQVWFAGVHADVGGGYIESESGLAKITLDWMLTEARAAQLLIDEAQWYTVFPENDASDLVGPDPLAPMHNELDKLMWKILQWVPRRYWIRDSATGNFVRRWNFSPKPMPRFIPKGSDIHPTVSERMEKIPEYRPENLLAKDNPNDSPL